MPPTAHGICSIDFEKGQAGASDYALSLFAETSQNPVLQHAAGILLVMYNVPSLPTLPLSSTVLKHIWPRLKSYVFLNSSDPLYLTCEEPTEMRRKPKFVLLDGSMSVCRPCKPNCLLPMPPCGKRFLILTRDFPCRARIFTRRIFMTPCGTNLFGEIIMPVCIILNSSMIPRGYLFAIIVLALKMQLWHMWL